MKRAGSLVMAAALLCAAGGRAQDDNSAAATAAKAADAAPASSPDTPYAAIVARNMFGLVPIPPPPDPESLKPPPEPPPKITPTGIMTIFHKDQAIFKVADKPKPGQPAVELSHVLAEGDMDDDITVVKINRVDGIITFNNHGTIQDLPLVAAKDGAGGGGASGGGPGGPGGPGMANRAAAQARLAGMNQPMSGGGMAPFQGRNQAAGGNPGNAGMSAGAGANFGGTPMNANHIYQPEADPSPMTPEQQALFIETQRKIYEQQGSPLSKVLPPLPGGPAARQLLDQLDNPQQ